MRITILFLTFLFLNICQLYAEYNYGLRFKSKDVEKKFRTGLDITQTGAISFNQGFRITFDLSFRSFDGFGYILRLKDVKTGAQLDLISKSDKASPGMYLVFNKKEIEQSINLSKISNDLNRWNSIAIQYDAQTGIVELTFNDETISEQINYPGNSDFFLGFGVVNNYGFDTKEVPFISIRDVSIYTDGKHKYCWPLNEQEGSISKDSFTGKEAELKNPEWELPHHARWMFLNSIKLSEKPKIAYDNSRERIYLVCDGNKIYYHDLKDNRFDSIVYSGNPPLNEKDNQFIITEDSKLLVYSHVVDNLSVFDREGAKWSQQIEMHDSLPTYWHHNKLINPLNNKVTTICGYGFYKYNSDILEFDEIQKKWQKTDFSGDSIFPRYLSALGQNQANKDQFYLFGGLGNKSGDQVLGTRFYYDLYLIDFRVKSIKRIWDLQGLKTADFTPVNSLWIDEDQKSFYTLCFAHNDEKSSLKILKASLTSPEYEFIGDSIPYYFIDVQSYADIFYWKSHRKMVAVTSCMTGDGRYEIIFYSIQTPPGNLEPEEVISEKKSFQSHFKFIFLIGLVLILIIAFYFFRKKIFKKRVDNPSAVVNYLATGLKNPCKAEPLNPGSINLFGGLQIIDNKGQNITYRFSPTVKELFVLILLHSDNPGNGISSVELREILWPDKQIESANNNRGVNIAKLRSILGDVGGLEIIHENSSWRLKADNTIFCDYFYISELISENDLQYFLSEENIFQLLKYLKRGDILPEIQTEWIDKHKSEIDNEIVALLEMLMQQFEMNKQPGIVLEIANTVFLFDQCNETAIKYKCRALNHLGKHGLAVKTYDEFALKYESLYGEEYKENIKNLLKD
jgi:two-component SAPR family response regulator